MARVTADNLVLILRAKSAEARANAAAAERDRLADAAAEQRDPWLSHVTAFCTCTHQGSEFLHYMAFPRFTMDYMS